MCGPFVASCPSRNTARRPAGMPAARAAPSAALNESVQQQLQAALQEQQEKMEQRLQQQQHDIANAVKQAIEQHHSQTTTIRQAPQPPSQPLQSQKPMDSSSTALSRRDREVRAQAMLNTAVANAVKQALGQQQSSAGLVNASGPSSRSQHARDAPRLRSKPNPPLSSRSTYGHRPQSANPGHNHQLTPRGAQPPTTASYGSKPDFDPLPAPAGGGLEPISRNTLRWNREQALSGKLEREVERLRSTLASTQRQLTDSNQRANVAASTLKNELGPLRRRVREAEIALEMNREEQVRRLEELSELHATELADQAADFEAQLKELDTSWRERQQALEEKLTARTEGYERQIRELRSSLHADERAAIQIQSNQRRHNSQRALQASRGASRTVQSAERRRLAKRKYDFHKLAAARIQGVARGKAVRRHQQSLLEAVLVLQRYFRTYRARARLRWAVENAQRRRHEALLMAMRGY